MTDVAGAASGVSTDTGYGGLISQMKKNDKESDEANKGYIEKIENTKIPPAPTLTPAPELKQSDPLNGFGSAATWLATFGSMLTRRPLTNALNATADVMDAHKTQDAVNFKNKWDTWKTETENAWKMAEWNQELYKDMLSKTEAEQKITASSTKNKTLEMAIQAKMQESYHKDMIRQIKQGAESQERLKKFVDDGIEKDRKEWKNSGRPLEDFDENSSGLKWLGKGRSMASGKDYTPAAIEKKEKEETAQKDLGGTIKDIDNLIDRVQKDPGLVGAAGAWRRNKQRITSQVGPLAKEVGIDTSIQGTNPEATAFDSDLERVRATLLKPVLQARYFSHGADAELNKLLDDSSLSDAETLTNALLGIREIVSQKVKGEIPSEEPDFTPEEIQAEIERRKK